MKQDMRAIRTEKSIKAAFIKLLAEKKYESITVQDIVNEAYINRNTFYLHYIDKADLFQKYCAECLKEFEASLGNKIINKLDDNYIASTLKDIHKTIENNKDFYRIMMVASDSSYFTERITEVIRKRIVGTKSTKNDFFTEFFTTGFIGVIRMYLREEIIISEKEFSDALFTLLHENLYSIFGGMDSLPLRNQDH